jgi:hypothetical protein
MSQTQHSSGPGTSQFDMGTSQRCIHFVVRPDAGDVVLMIFKDPAPVFAVVGPAASAVNRETAGGVSDDQLLVALLDPSDPEQSFAQWMQNAQDPHSAAPVYVKYRGLELGWRPGEAVLQCEAVQVDALLPAVVEFAHYERELRRLENEIAAAWIELDEDRPLAFDVTSSSLRRSKAIGARMEQTLQRRMRLARIEPHLHTPEVNLPASAQKLGEELREKAATETRAETVSNQIEVFEHVYEMASQRMGEYRAARQGNIMEWVIVVLLAAETMLMLAQTVWRTHS